MPLQVGWKSEVWRPILRPYLQVVFEHADGEINVTQMMTIPVNGRKHCGMWRKCWSTQFFRKSYSARSSKFGIVW